MSLLFLTVAGLLLLLPGIGAKTNRWVSSKTWLRVAVSSLVSGLVFLEIGFLLLAVPTVFRSLGLTGVAALCERVAGHLVPGGPWVGWPAAAAAAGLPVMFVLGSLRSRSRQRALWHAAGLHGTRTAGTAQWEVWLIPDQRPLALAVPGKPGRVIVSTGTRDLLPSDEEFWAVTRHEIGHLRYRHGTYGVVFGGIGAAVGWLWPVRRTISAARLGLERLADDVAAGSSRRHAAAVSRALLRLAGQEPLPAPGSLFASRDLVAERLRALEGHYRGSQSMTAATVGAVASLVAVGAVTLGVWIGHAHALVTVAPFCVL